MSEFRAKAREYFESIADDIFSVMDEYSGNHTHITIPVYYDGVVDEARCNTRTNTIQFWVKIAVGERAPFGISDSSALCDDYKWEMIHEITG